MTEITARLSTALADRYKIDRQLGVGGMATVYLAEDLKHHRKVAVKVLRPELAAVLGAERFVQEITTTANLQHPNILPLFDSGEADGFLYYVMPYIDGETLRYKLNRETQLGIEEAVRIATEVADALDYAHRHGVIHRDIKPENILLHDGRPMVADFGIALAVSAAAGGRMTETGLSLGTPHYMSPEQATADRDLTNRSDIYSLGSVLYEMLTGDPPHTGSSAQQIIMKIVTEEAQPVTALRKSVPPNVAAAIAKAVEKLPADRFESAAKFREALSDPAFAAGPSTAAPSQSAQRPVRHPIATAGVGAALLAVGILIGVMVSQPAAGPPDVVRFRVDPPDGARLSIMLATDVPFALSPDHKRIVFVATDRGDLISRLYVRDTDRLDAVPVPGTERAANPFFSPDGRTIGFVSTSDSRLRKVGLDGGPVTTVAADVVHRYVSPTWVGDGSIVFMGVDFRLHRVSSSGGASEPLSDSILVVNPSGADLGARRSFSSDRADGLLTGTLAFPAALPGGRSVIVTACAEGVLRGSASCSGDIRVLDIETGVLTSLGIRAQRAWSVPGGYLVLATASTGTLFAVKLDLESLEIDGDPVALVDGLGARPRVAVSRSGAIAYLPGQTEADRVIVQVTRNGAEQVIVSKAALYRWVRLSPDETRIAMVLGDLTGAYQVYVHDRRTGTTSPLTFAGENHRPSWSPDGQRIVYSSAREGVSEVWTVPADGSAPAEPVAPGRDVRQLTATSWTQDGAWIVIDGEADDGDNAGADDIYALPASGEGDMPTVVGTPASEQTGEVSPNGQWIAYVSDDAGGFQVYLQPFLRPGGRTLVSAGAAYEPAWASDNELTYVATESDSLILARLEFGESVRVTRTALFDVSQYTRGNPSWREYDVSRDGQRFIFTRATSAAEPESPVVVLNWTEEVRRAFAARDRGR